MPKTMTRNMRKEQYRSLNVELLFISMCAHWDINEYFQINYPASFIDAARDFKHR